MNKFKLPTLCILLMGILSACSSSSNNSLSHSEIGPDICAYVRSATGSNEAGSVGDYRYITLGDFAGSVLKYLEENTYRCDELTDNADQVIQCTQKSTDNEAYLAKLILTFEDYELIDVEGDLSSALGCAN